MFIKDFYDQATNTITYVLHNRNQNDHAIIIDPVWDYDPASSTLSLTSFKSVQSYLKDHSLSPSLVIETHAHADHVTSAQIFKKEYPNLKVGIGKNIQIVQSTFKKVFGLGEWLKTDGSQFDVLFDENKIYEYGSIKFSVLFTPGHTPACTSILVGDNLFTGDSLFMPDSGTGRCDFPDGSAEKLFYSITEKIYSLPKNTKIWVGHDYQPNNRTLKFQTTVEEEMETNIHIKKNTLKEDYIKFRTERDKTLSAPRLLLPSIQLNINAGILPPPNPVNGTEYLQIPIRKKS